MVAEPVPTRPDGSPLRVLVVDDSSTMRSVAPSSNEWLTEPPARASIPIATLPNDIGEIIIKAVVMTAPHQKERFVMVLLPAP